jgi:hypothetical protein
MMAAHSGCTVADSSAYGLSVDASSTTATTVDFNNDFPETSASTATEFGYYSWGGIAYTSAAAFNAGTGQGAHDSTAANAQVIDSANSDAVGELSTDIWGNPRVDDPYVANTGAGTYSYYDRGAFETVPSILVSTATNWPTMMPDATSGTFSANVADTWSNYPVTSCTYNFGDSTGTTTVAPANGTCVTEHSYSSVGDYTIKLTVAVSGGLQTTTTAQIVVDSGGQLLSALSVSKTGPRDIAVASLGYHGWNILECDYDFGDGQTATLRPGTQDAGLCPTTHHYTTIGTYPVKLTVKDSDGQVASTSGTFTSSGYYYTPLTNPVRILDTRNAIGVPTAKVGAGGDVKLQITGANNVPSGATAVVLNVTATDVVGGGYVTAYPDLTSVPSASNLNFGAGQTVANTVVVKLGTDGAVDLHYSGAGSTDLIADLEGYYAVDGGEYIGSSPGRVLDTRATKSTLQPGATVRVNLGLEAGVTAATLNLTVTNPTKNGNITAYADDSSKPGTSNLNFGTGQTIANEAYVRVGADGYVDFTNNSTGTTDLIVDFTGAFAASGGWAFVPMAPTRELDTRKPSGYLLVNGKQDKGALPGYTTGDLEFPGFPALGAVVTPRAVAANITVTQPTKGGYISAYPNDMASVPNASTVNFGPGQTVPNAATTMLGQIGVVGINLYNGSPGTVQLVVDIEGYYA